jgi:hypothetical protein
MNRLTQLRSDLSDIQEDLYTQLAETPVTSDASPIISALGDIAVALGPNSRADDTELRNVLDSAKRAMEGNGNE